MKTPLAAILVLLLPALAGEELPLIRAAGTSLETFEIVLRLEAVDRTTPEGLARAFARFEEEHHGVRRRFAELVRDAHLDLLRAYYARDLVERQAKAYEAMEQKGYRAELKDIRAEGDQATAELRRTYIVFGKEREEVAEIDLVRDANGWRIRSIRDRGRDGRFVERPLGAPPPLKPAEVPAPAPPDLSSAKAALASVRAAALRFGALRHNAALSLTDRFFDITAAFHGEDAARSAREGRPTVTEAKPRDLELSEPAPRLADLLRIEVTVHEEKGGKRQAVAQWAFDLRAEGSQWKVAGEYRRPDPKGPFEAVPDLAIFFARP
jgi:hypothetical protein